MRSRSAPGSDTAPSVGEGEDALEDAPPPSREELTLLERLRAGDEAAFTTLVDRHHGPLRRLARMYVSSEASAEEVVQETWVAVIDGLSRFEGRSSLKTWIYRILVNRAKTRGVREGRTVALGAPDGDGDDAPAVDPSHFDGRGAWATPTRIWETADPERRLLEKEAIGALEAALATLPERQRAVVVLRDVEGWTTEEVCALLQLQETNQRVLLHRARARLREALENVYHGRRDE